MTDTVDRLIASLRAHHDRLAEVISDLTPEQLDGPSAAEKWSIAQVLSHLGSGAEIGGARYAAAIAGVDAAPEDNQTIWARWDNSTSAEQAKGFLEHDGAFVARVEALDAEQRESLTLDLGFGPDTWSLEAALASRLNEVAAHSWDVFAGLDDSATLDAEGAELLLASYAGPLGFLLQWVAKPDQLTGPATVDLTDYALNLADGASITSGSPTDATSSFRGSHEAAVRLLTGRLKDGYTAPDISVDGTITLDDLRNVFPGY